MQLTSQIQSTAEDVQTAVEREEDADQVRRSVDDLQDSAQETFDALGDELPAETRDRIDDALSRLGE